MSDSRSPDQAVAPRPLSVSIISVLLVIYGLVSLAPKIVLMSSTEVYERTVELSEAMSTGGLLEIPMALQIAHGFAASLIVVIAGVFLWRGHNWARWLAIGWLAFSLGFVFVVVGPVITFYLKVPAAILVTVFLMTPKASAFLRGP